MPPYHYCIFSLTLIYLSLFGNFFFVLGVNDGEKTRIIQRIVKTLQKIHVSRTFYPYRKADKCEGEKE